MKKFITLLIGLSFVPLVSFGDPKPAPAPRHPPGGPPEQGTTTIHCPTLKGDVAVHQVLPGDGKLVKSWLVTQAVAGHKTSKHAANGALVVDRIVARHDGKQIICVDKTKALKVVATVNHVKACNKIHNQAVCLREMLPRNR